MDIKYKGVESDPDDFENLYSTRIMNTITKLQNATFGRLTMTARMKAGRMKAAVCKVPEYRMFLNFFLSNIYLFNIFFPLEAIILIGSPV